MLRFSARRRIPAQARGVKKNRGGTLPGSSRMSDNEHTLASLGKPVMLSVQHPPGPPIPALGKAIKELVERAAIVGENAGHIFPQAPAGAILCKNGKIAEGEISARVSQSCSQSRN